MMKKVNQEKLANWIFTIVLLGLILPWSGIVNRLVSSVKEQMAKPIIEDRLFEERWAEVRSIYDQAESKMKDKNYTAMDYARGFTRLYVLKTDLETKYRFDPRQSLISERWTTNYGPLREQIKERDFGGTPSMLALNNAMNQARQEAGMVDGLINDPAFTAKVAKFFKWMFLFAWPISLIPILLLYIRRCQIRKISFKEMVILSPIKFFGFWIFGIIGLMANFPNDTAGLRRYLRLKSAYMRTREEKSWWLNEQEEAMLWQRAKMPLERFDQRVQQTLVYSRVAAFVSSLFLWVFIAPFRALAQAPKEQPVATAKVSPEIQKQKRLAFELFNITNFQQIGGLVQVKALAKTEQNLSWGKRLQLSAVGNIFTWGKSRMGYAGKADFSSTNPVLPYASIEIVPGSGLIDKVCLGRIFDPAYQWYSPGAMQSIESPYFVGYPTDVGISVAGHFGQITWALARVDGNGGLLLWEDPNKTKDFSGSLTWTPKSLFGLDAFKWRTVYRGGDRVSDGKRFILGNDVSLTKGKFVAEAGWIVHREGTKNLDGGWVLGFVTIDNKWRPLVQFDNQVGKGNRLTVGLNFLVDKTRRIQLNVEKTKLGTTLRAQLQATF